MLTYQDLINRNEIEQVKLSLAVYKDRGEYSGSLLSAMQCLTHAGYELDTECWEYMYKSDDEMITSEYEAREQATFYDTNKYL